MNNPISGSVKIEKETAEEKAASIAEDRLLVTRCREGDLGAFDTLITKYRTRLYNMVLSIVRNEQDAWDVCQEGFVRAWKAIGRFRDESTFSTWIYRIMTNAALDSLRRAKSHPTTSFDEAFPDGAAPAGSPSPGEGEAARSFRRAEIADRINEALATLSPEHRAVILLKEVEGLQYNEIAERTGISIGTVMSRLFYARKSLQKKLKDIHEDK